MALLARTPSLQPVAVSQIKTGKPKTGAYEAAAVSPGAKTPGGIASEIILENYEVADFRRILELNRFDDVTWFNKEAFEETLLLVPLLLSLEIPEDETRGKRQDQQHGKQQGRKQHIETIAAVTEVFSRAKEASGYRFDELSRVLSEL